MPPKAPCSSRTDLGNLSPHYCIVDIVDTSGYQGQKRVVNRFLSGMLPQWHVDRVLPQRVVNRIRVKLPLLLLGVGNLLGPTDVQGHLVGIVGMGRFGEIAIIGAPKQNVVR